MIKAKSNDVAQLFNGYIEEEGVLIGARSDGSLWALLRRELRIPASVNALAQSSILKAIGSDLDIFSLSDVEEFAFVVDGCGVVRVKRTASGLWNLFFHQKK